MTGTLRTFKWPLGFTVITVIAAFFVGGPEVALVVALLAVLEISISFDNAIVNAAVLRTMTERWQRIFLTWGILIAVFGMRLVFPIVIVAAAAGIGIPEVLRLAVDDQAAYAEQLEASYPIIASFGGMFLLMVALEFFLDPDREDHWLRWIERPLGHVGHVKTVSPAIAGLALILVAELIGGDAKGDIAIAGLAGMVAHLISAGAAEAMEARLDDEIADVEESEAELQAERGDDPSAAKHAGAAVAKGGLASFLYLELLDASFSFDGVIGAFAISTNIFVIAAGLGLGAIYIRTMTVHLVHQGTLQRYRYLESGAHWAIGILAVLLFLGIEVHVPEVVTGLLGASLILASFLASVRANRREERRGEVGAG